MQRGEIAIVGAGIGGLALAVAAERIGWTPVVYERQPAACTNGGVLLVWANGLRALSALGLKEFEAGTMPSCTWVQETLFKNWKGERLLTLPAPDPAEGELRSLLVPRSTLIEALVAAADPGGTTIRWDHECTGYTALGRGVLPRVGRNGDPARPLPASPADVLVGCDGARSVIRRRLFPGAEPLRPSYHNAWTGISHVSESQWPYEPGHTV
ncbi:MAG: FAD-dependent oxidoreductase, partial [Candidatus Binatia bacterium]